MKNTLVFLGLLFALLATGYAKGAVKNRLCAQAQLTKLQLHAGMEDEEGTEVCALDAANTPEPAKEAIAAIKDIHLRMARVFGTTPERLFAKGVSLTITKSVTNINGSFDPDGDLIDLDNPASASGYLNRGVYAHELAHWVYNQKTPLVPMTFRSAGDSHFWGEPLADTAALAAVGEVTTPEPSLPACLIHRKIGPDISYSNSGIGFFYNSHQRRQTWTCCQEIYKTMSPESDAFQICSLADEENVSSQIDHSLPYDNSPFSTAAVAKALRDYSRYQLGTPVNSFLVDLAEQTRKPVLQYFFDVAHSVPVETHECRIKSDPSAGSVRVPYGSMLAHLSLVKKKLGAADQIIYDRVAAKHGLEALKTLEPAERKLRVPVLGAIRFIRDEAEGTGARLSEEHRCHISLALAEMLPLEESCALECAEVR